MKKAIQALLRRIFGPLFFGLILATLTTACAASFRTIGQHDPTVEAIKALTEVLKTQQPPSCSPTQPLGGVMQWDYMGPGAKPCFWTDAGGVTHGTLPYWPPPTPTPEGVR